jgi:hypothetical protein
MADSTSRLFVSLILFWTFLTIFSNVFHNYLEEDLSTSITSLTDDASLDYSQKSWWENIFNGVFNVMDEIPIIKLFVPLMKMLTFGYSDKIPGLVVIFLDATLLFTIYVVLDAWKK